MGPVSNGVVLCDSSARLAFSIAAPVENKGYLDARVASSYAYFASVISDTPASTRGHPVLLRG